jgi:hypothetical protein
VTLDVPEGGDLAVALADPNPWDEENVQSTVPFID